MANQNFETSKFWFMICIVLFLMGMLQFIHSMLLNKIDLRITQLEENVQSILHQDAIEKGF